MSHESSILANSRPRVGVTQREPEHIEIILSNAGDLGNDGPVVPFARFGRLLGDEYGDELIDFLEDGGYADATWSRCETHCFCCGEEFEGDHDTEGNVVLAFVPQGQELRSSGATLRVVSICHRCAAHEDLMDFVKKAIDGTCWNLHGLTFLQSDPWHRPRTYSLKRPATGNSKGTPGKVDLTG